MLWEIEIHPAPGQPDRDAARVTAECHALAAASIRDVRTARSFLIQGELDEQAARRIATELLVDPIVETHTLHALNGGERRAESGEPEGRNQGSGVRDQRSEVRGQPPQRTTDHGPRTTGHQLNVLYKPGVTDNVAQSTHAALHELGYAVEAVATCRKYIFNPDAAPADLQRAAAKILANDAIEHVVWGPLSIGSIALGSKYEFQLITVPIREMDDDALMKLSRQGQLFLSLPEMQTIRGHFQQLDRDPTDAELETIAQTWSEHCSHKTLAGRIRYRDESGERQFENMLKETIFAATQTIRQQLGPEDWCISVFKDNAGIVKFDDRQNVCFKVETHNHPSALEPYGGANTGLGGVIRDPLGTGLGARPLCNTDVFCFAPPDIPHESLPPGVLHPKVVMKGVVAGVRDYGNRMGIPTVNGAVYFDERYLGNPLVYCGNVAMIPVDKCEKHMQPGDLIVTVGGRTGRDGIHGATFSSAELTHESETLSGGAVQIGNAITEKMMADVILAARDRNLYTAITDCGAGGFSSAVGEMGEETGAEVWLDRAPLKYSGLSYTEIWISEAQERMVLAVPPAQWEEFEELCNSEGVEATIIGEFTTTGRLVLKYDGRQVADLSMDFLHNGRPPVVREAVYEGVRSQESGVSDQKSEIRGQASQRTTDHGPRTTPVTNHQSPVTTLKSILSSPNVCSKEWIIRQYDHEVQAGSVVKPLVGVQNDGPSDAAVVRPDLDSLRGLVISCGMNPRYGDLDPYWMAASAIDEAVRNCIAVGADPRRIAILDNFCWGNTECPETLGTLVRAALACHDIAIAYGTPFISGKDSLNNEFSWTDAQERIRTIAIPPSLLISALGQIDDITRAVTMDLKQPGNLVYLVGRTRDELGGSHYHLVTGRTGGQVPHVDPELAPRIFAALHDAIDRGLVRACHDLSEGGLAVAAAEMAFAGGLGLDLDLRPLALTGSPDDDVPLLFSESNTRFLVEVPRERAPEFTTLFGGLPLAGLGRVTEGDRLRIHGVTGATLIDARWAELKEAWQRPLAWA